MQYSELKNLQHKHFPVRSSHYSVANKEIKLGRTFASAANTNIVGGIPPPAPPPAGVLGGRDCFFSSVVFEKRDWKHFLYIKVKKKKALFDVEKCVLERFLKL